MRWNQPPCSSVSDLPACSRQRRPSSLQLPAVAAAARGRRGQSGVHPVRQWCLDIYCDEKNAKYGHFVSRYGVSSSRYMTWIP
eukprot:SAG25_NODE_14_length_24446_cov_22.033678_13_plen_83_part_00